MSEHVEELWAECLQVFAVVRSEQDVTSIKFIFINSLKLTFKKCEDDNFSPSADFDLIKCVPHQS